MSSMAPGGMEMPVRKYSSAFQPKCTSSRPRLRASLTRLRTRRPASMTSGPIPSPGITAIFFVIAAADYRRATTKRSDILIRMKTLPLVVLLSLVSISLFADADLSIVPVTTGNTFVAGARRLVAFTIRNNGPDVAKDVVVTITGSDEISGNCTAGSPVGNGTMAIGEQLINPSLLFPDTPGDVTVTASVTSSSPDPNSGNNSASVTVHLSPNPDVSVFLRAPLHADLALPFQLSINVSNESAVVAHDVNTTVDFRPDVTVKTLPGVCTNPAAGRVVCHSDAMSQGSVPAFVVTLVAPPTYGSIDVTATSTELEPDFDPSSNIARASIPLNLSFYVT